MYLNKLYRSDKYCEIPLCNDKKYGCSNTPGRLISHQQINVPKNIILICGCPAFDYTSHNESCEFFDVNENKHYPRVIGNEGICTSRDR